MIKNVGALMSGLKQHILTRQSRRRPPPRLSQERGEKVGVDNGQRNVSYHRKPRRPAVKARVDSELRRRLLVRAAQAKPRAAQVDSQVLLEPQESRLVQLPEKTMWAIQ